MSRLLAISGVKNSGKTTLVCALVELLTEMGWKIATIKHDGHDFEADVPGTDTYRHLHAGAYAAAVFSSEKYMVVKKKREVSEQQLRKLFPEADLILLEGFKYSEYPKIEVVRWENSMHPVAADETLLAVATDMTPADFINNNLEWSASCPDCKILDLNQPRQIAKFIQEHFR